MDYSKRSLRHGRIIFYQSCVLLHSFVAQQNGSPALNEAVTVQRTALLRDYLARRELSQIRSIDRPNKSEPLLFLMRQNQTMNLRVLKAAEPFAKSL